MYHNYGSQNRHNPLSNNAPPVNPNFQQYPYNPNGAQEIEDFDVDQFLNLEEFDIPIENNSPRQFQNTQQHLTPIIYQGPLYSDSGSSNYILWPIQKENTIPSHSKYSSYPYYIVIKKNSGEFIDVISRTKNIYHTRCIRIDSSRREFTTLAPQTNTGYQCAHDFLDDNLIRQSLEIAWNNIGESNRYPTPYFGRLYPVNSDYMIWPIFSRGGLDDYKFAEAGPYFLVIDRQGNLIGTVVEGLSGNFLRCPRSKKPSKKPLIIAPNHLSEPGPKPKSKPGYYCGWTFFSDEYINKAVKVAKILRGKPFRKLPIEYSGPPFNKPLLLWPIKQNGQIYEKGSIGKYRVVLTNNFDIIAVAIMKNSDLHLCEKSMMEEGKDHEKNDYYCDDHLLLNTQLVRAAEMACSSFVEKKYKFFPARYEGPDFDKTGPYYTFPTVWNNSQKKRPGRDRVVINSKCELVGALTKIPKIIAGKRGLRLVQCVKYEPDLSKTFIESNFDIVEHPRRGIY